MNQYVTKSLSIGIFSHVCVSLYLVFWPNHHHTWVTASLVSDELILLWLTCCFIGRRKEGCPSKQGYNVIRSFLSYLRFHSNHSLGVYKLSNKILAQFVIFVFQLYVVRSYTRKKSRSLRSIKCTASQ